MFSSRELMIIIVALFSTIQTAIADEAADAVQVLSKLWKGKSDTGSHQFVGDSKTYKMRLVGQTDDGTVYVLTNEAPFRLLEISDAPEGVWFQCFHDHKCLVVGCRFKRECIYETEVKSDPVYRDPQREGTYYSKSQRTVPT